MEIKKKNHQAEGIITVDQWLPSPYPQFWNQASQEIRDQSQWSHLLDLIKATQFQILSVKLFGLSTQPSIAKCCFIGSVTAAVVTSRMRAAATLQGNRKTALYFRNSYTNKCQWNTFRGKYFCEGHKILPSTEAGWLD